MAQRLHRANSSAQNRAQPCRAARAVVQSMGGLVHEFYIRSMCRWAGFVAGSLLGPLEKGPRRTPITFHHHAAFSSNLGPLEQQAIMAMSVEAKAYLSHSGTCAGLTSAHASHALL